MAERDIVNDIITFCNKYGKAIKIHGSQYIERGTPDIVGSVRVKVDDTKYTHVPFFCEVKQPGKTPEAIQIYRLMEWFKVGCFSTWVTSLDMFKEELRQFVDNNGSDLHELDETDIWMPDGDD